MAKGKIQDKRKTPRRPMRYLAWLALTPNERRGCLLSDISATGARIDVDDSKVIPDRFLLLLSGTGTARRACQVMWRKPKQIGVKFESHLADAESATLVPKPDAETQAAKANAEPAENA
jgi:hypothetical protein